MVSATFLVTDIEGSTRLWELHPGSMASALDRHDQLITATVQRHGGRVFKHLGDGFAVIFTSAQNAIKAAAEIQNNVREAFFPGVGTIKVRIGVHSGDAERRGGDYFGSTINEVARLANAAHGGQVVVSMVTARMVEATTTARLLHLGEYRLRDLGRSESIYQLRVGDRHESFPPPRRTVTEAQAPLEESLWKIRLRLFRDSVARNWAIFRKSRVGLIGVFVVATFGLMAILQPILIATNVWPAAIYDPLVGNEPNPPIDFKIVVETVTDSGTEIGRLDARRVDPAAEIGDTVALRRQPAPPGNGHILGTDPLGRDVMSQLMFGARAAFALGAVAAMVTVVLATTVGAMAAYFRGWVDRVLMRFADLLLMLPALALLIALSSVVIDYQLWHLAVLIGVLNGFGGTAVLLKSQALTVVVKPFVDAARVAGGSSFRIITTHIVPNVLPLSFLYMMFTVTAAIALEATLSFLGLSQIDMSWGIMLQLAQDQGYLLAGMEYWWLLIPAGGAITLLAGAFYLVGRGLDEVVNPKLRSR